MTRTAIQAKLAPAIDSIRNGLPSTTDTASRAGRVFRALVHIGCRLMMDAGMPIEAILAQAAEAIADESGMRFVFAIGKPVEAPPKAFGASLPQPAFKC